MWDTLYGQRDEEEGVEEAEVATAQPLRYEGAAARREVGVELDPWVPAKPR